MRLQIRFLVFAACALSVASLVRAAAPTTEEVRQRVRSELAAIMKKEAASLPFEKPVKSFGADELDIVEWVMAIEEAFRIRIPDEKLIDAKTKIVREDLSIDMMSQITREELKTTEPNKPAETTSLTRPEIWESCPFAVASDSVSHG